MLIDRCLRTSDDGHCFVENPQRLPMGGTGRDVSSGFAMFTSNPSVARNEFLEPPPQDQSRATLVLGRQRVVCRLTEVSIGGFCVMIPRATTWTGEPQARLITHDSTYKVRIIKQEIRYEGIEITLERIEDIPADDNLTMPQRWVIHGSRCCAIGLILAITYCLIAAPGGVTSGPAHHVSLSDLSTFWFSSWSTPTAGQATPPDSESEDPLLLPAITVSTQTGLPAAGAERSVRDLAVPQDIRRDVGLDRASLLRAALNAADSQRSRPVNSTTLPWLFTTRKSPVVKLPTCRMVRSAEEDLQAFAIGLNSLSTAARVDATESLRNAIAATETSPAFAVAGFPMLRLIRSADAEIYFRVVDREIELVRILPVELPDTSPTRVPSAASHHSLRR